MSIAHALIDQWVDALVQSLGDSFGVHPPDRRPSAAFVLLCARTLLDLGDHEVLPALTDGEDDLGIDLFFIHDPEETSFRLPITLFSGKYGTNPKRDQKAFPANEIVKLVSTLQTLFDPNKPAHGNERIRAQAAEVHGFIREGYEPSIRVVACSMGRPWDANGQQLLDASALPQVQWEHVSPEDLLAMRRGPEAITAKLPLSGTVMKEGFGFHTSLVGRMSVAAVHDLIEAHGPNLIDRNVRRYLGGNNRVNREIASTLRDPEQRKHLFFMNNGLTFVCSKLAHNQLQTDNHLLRCEKLQLINGAQTAFTLHRVLKTAADAEAMGQSSVLIRVYELEEAEDPQLVSRIIRATNSQSPVHLHDLRANDPIQRDLELGMKELGWTYLRQQRPNGSMEKAITPTEAAAAILAVLRRLPHLARFQQKKHFGSLYEKIFTASLTAEQVILAVLLVRQLELPKSSTWDGRLVHYGRFHLAMRFWELPESMKDGRELNDVIVSRHLIAIRRLGLEIDAPPSVMSGAHRRPELAVSTEVLGKELTQALAMASDQRTPYQNFLIANASKAALTPA